MECGIWYLKKLVNLYDVRQPNTALYLSDGTE
jgi:hypothetical protein